MGGRTGVRFALETALIVATAVATGLAHLGAWTIVGAVVAVWLATSVFEYSRSHPRAAKAVLGRRPETAFPLPEEESSFEGVRVLAGPAAGPSPPPEQAEPSAETRVLEESALLEETSLLENTALLESTGSPVALEPVEEPEPQPVAERETEPEPPPQPVPVASAPWSWNVWNLERVVRERASENEELGLLLLYLRDYASPSGMLPPDFDALVRESFGDLLAAPV